MPSAGDKSVTDSECSYSEDDIESGSPEKVVDKDLAIKVCRICHLGLELHDDATPDDSISELGCSCKDDLGIAHRKCAEDWFKIKGNTVCEICGNSAANITVVQAIEAPSAVAGASSGQVAPVIYVQTTSFCHSRRIMNFLLGCMIMAFLISWLFHFKVLS